MHDLTLQQQEEDVRTYRRRKRLGTILTIAGYVLLLAGIALLVKIGEQKSWGLLPYFILLVVVLGGEYFTNRCPNCHRYVNERAPDFCPNCRAPLVPSAIGQTPPEPQPKASWRETALVMGLFIFVVIPCAIVGVLISDVLLGQGFARSLNPPERDTTGTVGLLIGFFMGMWVGLLLMRKLWRMFHRD